MRRYPHYYKLVEHEIGTLNPDVLAWTEDRDERELLERLFGTATRSRTAATDSFAASPNDTARSPRRLRRWTSI